MVSSLWERKGVVIFLLLAPALVLVFGLLLYPLGYSFYVSLFDLNLTRPGTRPFVGLGNYLEALVNRQFWS